MHARKISSILIIAILAAVTTFSSSTFLTPALAQIGAEEGGETTQESTGTGTRISTGTGTDTGANTGADTDADTGADTDADTGADTDTDTGADNSAASQDYQEFETCLTEAQEEEGFATEDEIRECFQPIYIGGEASEDEDSEGGSQDEDSEGGSQDEGENNSESNDSG